MLRKHEALALFCAVALGGAGTAQAYIDPGTGSYFFQMLVAALFGALYIIKSRWRQLKGWLQKKGPPASPDAPGK